MESTRTESPKTRTSKKLRLNDYHWKNTPSPKTPVIGILIVLTKEGKLVSTGPLSISAIRGFLLGFETASYTLNASIKIAKFVSSTLGISYQVPTDLSANAQDEKRIIPDEIAMGIVLIQAHKGLEVDGLPGADFIRRAMGLHQNITVTSHCRAAFMDESSNNSVKNASGKPIKIPDFSADESQNDHSHAT